MVISWEMVIGCIWGITETLMDGKGAPGSSVRESIKDITSTLLNDN